MRLATCITCGSKPVTQSKDLEVWLECAGCHQKSRAEHEFNDHWPSNIEDHWNRLNRARA